MGPSTQSGVSAGPCPSSALHTQGYNCPLGCLSPQSLCTIKSHSTEHSDWQTLEFSNYFSKSARMRLGEGADTPIHCRMQKRLPEAFKPCGTDLWGCGLDREQRTLSPIWWERVNRLLPAGVLQRMWTPFVEGIDPRPQRARRGCTPEWMKLVQVSLLPLITRVSCLLGDRPYKNLQVSVRGVVFTL